MSVPEESGNTKTKTTNVNADKFQAVGYLSNYEVYTYLKELKDSGSHGAQQQQDRLHQVPSNTHMPTLIYETLRYFKSNNAPCLVQSPEVIASFLQKISGFGLTKSEKLTILNLRPAQPVDIEVIVEECEERLTEDKVTELLGIIEESLPLPQTTAVKTEPESE